MDRLKKGLGKWESGKVMGKGLDGGMSLPV